MKVFLSTTNQLPSRNFKNDYMSKMAFGSQKISFGDSFKKDIEKQSQIDFLTKKISNFRATGNNNSYAGSLYYAINYFNELKKMKVKTIISLSYDCQSECKRAGLKYFGFAIPDSSNYDYDDKADKKEIAKNVCKFFEVVNEGNFFIGCNSGEGKVNKALYLNALLNPKFNDKNINIYNIDQRIAWEFMKIYQCFSEEDKKHLGYTEEFEKRIKDFSDEKGITSYL